MRQLTLFLTSGYQPLSQDVAGLDSRMAMGWMKELNLKLKVIVADGYNHICHLLITQRFCLISIVYLQLHQPITNMTEVDIKDSETTITGVAMKRDVTDFFWFFAFIAMFVTTGYLLYVLGDKDDYDREFLINRPRDQYGRMCGDSGNPDVADYPFLRFTDPINRPGLAACANRCEKGERKGMYCTQPRLHAHTHAS